MKLSRLLSIVKRPLIVWHKFYVTRLNTSPHFSNASVGMFRKKIDVVFTVAKTFFWHSTPD